MIEIVKQKADKRVRGYLRYWVYGGVVSGIFRRGGLYSRPTEHTVDRPKGDTSEGHVVRPPEDQYDTGRRTEGRHDKDVMEELSFPHRTLERVVTQLRQELNDFRTELEITKRLSPAPAVNRQQSRQARFTSTSVPRYSGKSNWEQYHDKFEAIVCSNGWDDVTAALQLLSHLDGDALNVALLVPVGPLQLPRTPGGVQASVSAGGTSTRGRSVSICDRTGNAG